MARDNRIVIADDPYNRPEDGPHMQFRLTYEGPLYATQHDPVRGQPDKRKEHKRVLRKRFHPQLKRLWEITPFLNTAGKSGPSFIVVSMTERESPPSRELLSRRYSMYGYNFVPLVTTDLCLICGIDILFLRPDPPGAVLRSGDIDNRIKTLLDALRLPEANEDYINNPPEDDETPFYCLLEDDKLITSLSVETDQLLERVNPRADMNDARLVITVRLRPYEMHLGNLAFGGIRAQMGPKSLEWRHLSYQWAVATLL